MSQIIFNENDDYLNELGDLEEMEETDNEKDKEDEEDEEDDEKNKKEEEVIENDENNENEENDENDDENKESEENEELEIYDEEDSDMVEINEMSNYINQSQQFKTKSTMQIKLRKKYCKMGKKKEDRNNNLFTQLSIDELDSKFKKLFSSYFTSNQLEKLVLIIRKYLNKKNKKDKENEENENKLKFMYTQLINSLWTITRIHDKSSSFNFIKSITDFCDYWNFYIFNDEKKIFEHNRDSKVLLEVEVVDGVHHCNKCKSNKTTSYKLQVRGADEPMTIFVTCTNCSNKWKE